MAIYQILYWHGIPVQVRAGRRQDRVSQTLAPRFQDAVDRVAMATKMTGTEAYLDGFKWGEKQERSGTPAEIVPLIVAELETTYADLDWRELVTELRGYPPAGPNTHVP
jgi:hypothetical protein